MSDVSPTAEADRPGRGGRRAVGPLPGRSARVASRRRARGRGRGACRRPAEAEELSPDGRGARRAAAGIAPPPPAPSGPPPRVVWQDEYLAVVDKPAGLIVHPGAGHATGTLVHALEGIVAGGEAGRPGIVHRLDRDTSGLMVVARSEEAHRRLSNLVRKRRSSEPTSLSFGVGRPRAAGGSRHRSAVTGTIRPGSRWTASRRATR